MTYSRPLLGTDTEKTKLSWFEYYWNCCIKQGWYNCWYSFQNWADLMGNNYQGYGLLPEDDDLEQCILYFWDSLEEDIYPKEFLEHLLQLADDVKTGKEKVVPFTREMMDEIDDLVGDLIDDLNLDEELDDEGTT